MNRIFSLKLITMIFLVIIFLSASFQGNTTTTTTNKISTLPFYKIGFLYPATGSLGPIGQGLLDGVTAAAHRVNIGNYGFNITVVKADTGTDPTTAKTSAQSLVSEGVQVIVGAAASSSTSSASEVTIPNRVPLISYASTSPSITVLNDSDYVFRTVASDAYQGVGLANLTYNSGNHTVYILNLDNTYGNSVAAKFKTAYAALGGKVLGQIPYDPASTSFSTEVSNIKTSGADAVVMVSYPTDANAIFADAKTQGLTDPFFATNDIALTSVTNTTGTRNYLKDKLFGTTPSTGANASATFYPQYLSDLTATGGSYGIYGDYAYDAFLLAAAAIHYAGSYNGTLIRDSLYKVANGFEGATAHNKAFNCAGDPISQTYDYWMVNQTDYSVATMKTAAVAFSNLGTVATNPCLLHPYTGPGIITPSPTTSNISQSSETITTNPGFETFSLVIGFITILFLERRKRK